MWALCLNFPCSHVYTVSTRSLVQPPHIVFSEQTAPNQAALYRLTGDTNPLHIDPAFAKMGGFDAPILHGLCFFGFAQRAVIKSFCGNDANRFRSIRARFAASVYPGERLITEMWLTAPNTVMFRCKVAERGVQMLQSVSRFPVLVSFCFSYTCWSVQVRTC